MTTLPETAMDDAVLKGGRHLRRSVNSERQAMYDDEVRRLIAAAESVMLAKGRTEPPRMTEIVHEAGMSNQAFYRHFRSRDDLIVATYEHGLLTLASYLAHSVEKAPDITGKIRALIDGYFAQIAEPRLSKLSKAILWNISRISRSDSEIEPVGYARIISLIGDLLADAGVDKAERSAIFVQTLLSGTTRHFHEKDETPNEEDRAALAVFCLRGLGITKTDQS
ncbi:TetR/AcrR family transcriptional regulator [Rhodococcus koreensis]